MKPASQVPRRPSAESGFALIEALVAILIFSIGILGLAGLQTTMTQAATQSRFRAEASYFASQLIGEMWVDQTNLAKYAMTTSGCTDTGYTKCTNWRAAVAAALPSGNATVTVTGTSSVSVTITWQLPGEAAANQYQISTMITS